MHRRSARSHRFATAILAAFATCWLAIVAVPPVVFLRWRDARLAVVSTPSAQEDWDRFRAEMRAQSGEHGPVRRKVPRSPEPPERVWLRDYPRVAVAAWLILTGFLGAVIGVLLSGTLRGPANPASPVSGRG